MEHLFSRPLEADRFGWSWFVGLIATSGRCSSDSARRDSWSHVRDYGCSSHRHFGFEGLGLPLGFRVRRNDQWEMARRSALLRSPLCNQNDGRHDDREEKDTDDYCDDD